MVHRKGRYNIVPAALSRSVSVSYVQVGLGDDDAWYRRMRNKIFEHPHKYPKWRVTDNKIYKFSPLDGPSLNDDLNWKFVIPKPLMKAVLPETHDAPISGHLGYYKTLRRVRWLYF